MTTLTRQQAMAALTAGGFSQRDLLMDTMVAIGAAESDLRVDVTGAKNPDGTEDYGWLQINSRYVTGPPRWDKARLLSDPAYNASCARHIYTDQGLRAWSSYDRGKHLPFMPPPNGPALTIGSVAWFLVADLQVGLNKAGAQLAVDGSFGPKTAAALQSFQQAHPLEAMGTAGPGYWAALTS